MDIGTYSFREFCNLAEKFHGYAAPGVLIGGYMVEKAKAALPDGTLFEAVVESVKCLPDAVQLLTLCSIGNQRLKILNLGRYAVNLYDKYSGEGVRVSLNLQKMRQWPELYAWFLKKKSKSEQDSKKLEREIEEAGDIYCELASIKIKPRYLEHSHSQPIGICPKCGEAFPADAGEFCMGCQGEAPYLQNLDESANVSPSNSITILPVEKAIGKIVYHDMTRIEHGKFKGAEFKRGQIITSGDICRLQTMGRFNIAVHTAVENLSQKYGVHENICAETFAKKMAGNGVKYTLPPVEGKIDFFAERPGLFCVNKNMLLRFNLVPMVMVACRNNHTLVKENFRLAGTRAIPLFLPQDIFDQALAILEEGQLFEVLPLRKAKTGILVTGTEIFQGLIEDKFIPVISGKVSQLGCDIIKTIIVPDDKNAIKEAIEEMSANGINLLVTTGGLSIDPDDVTRQALLDCGMTDIVHGMPVLPGTMSVVGKIKNDNTIIDVIGVPACALYYKTTFFDLILPKILAGISFNRMDAALMAEGGYCLSCAECTWPHCGFGK